MINSSKTYVILTIIIIFVLGGIYLFSPQTTVGPSIKDELGFNDMVAQEQTATSTASSSTTSNSILGTKWKWLYTSNMDGSTTTPKKVDKFIVSFNNDLTVKSTTDCNGLSGTFIVDDEVLSISPLAMTKMFCEGSQDAVYAKDLGYATSYVITGDALKINLYKDVGTMYFTKAN